MSDPIYYAQEKAPNRGKEYLGPHYDEAKRLHEKNPAFFPDPDTTPFKVVKGEEARAARAEFNASGLKGHHKHEISHGGPAVPDAKGLAYTGETTVVRPEGIEFGWMNNPLGKKGDFYAPNPVTGILIPGKNPNHTEASAFWDKVRIWQKETGQR